MSRILETIKPGLKKRKRTHLNNFSSKRRVVRNYEGLRDSSVYVSFHQVPYPSACPDPCPDPCPCQNASAQTSEPEDKNAARESGNEMEELTIDDKKGE